MKADLGLDICMRVEDSFRKCKADGAYPISLMLCSGYMRVSILPTFSGSKTLWFPCSSFSLYSASFASFILFFRSLIFARRIVVLEGTWYSCCIFLIFFSALVISSTDESVSEWLFSLL